MCGDNQVGAFIPANPAEVTLTVQDKVKSYAGKYVNLHLSVVNNNPEQVLDGGVVMVDVPDFMTLVAYKTKFSDTLDHAKKARDNGRGKRTNNNR